MSTLDTWTSVLIIFIHLVAVRSGASLLPVVGLLKSGLLDMDVLAGLLNSVSRGESLLQGGNNRGVNSLGKLDVDADVKVSELVVSVRRHTLMRDDLERVYRSASSQRFYISTHWA